MVAEVPDECLFQLGTLGAHPGSGHLGQDLGVAFTTDQGGHHVPPGDIRAVDGGIHRVCTAGRAGLDTNHRLCLRCEHRTRVILVLSALWSVSWLMTGLSGMLILGCAAMAVIALAVERRIPTQANGIKTPVAELRQA